jgi:hypothetical protein
MDLNKNSNFDWPEKWGSLQLIMRNGQKKAGWRIPTCKNNFYLQNFN